MARSQLDPPGRSLEEVLAEANAAVLNPKPSENLDLSGLEPLSKEELIVLLRRCNGVEYALLTEDEAYEAACFKLLAGGMMEKDVWKALPTLKEWMDRRKGKPMQRQQVDQRIAQKIDVNIRVIRPSTSGNLLIDDKSN